MLLVTSGAFLVSRPVIPMGSALMIDLLPACRARGLAADSRRRIRVRSASNFRLCGTVILHLMASVKAHGQAPRFHGLLGQARWRAQRHHGSPRLTMPEPRTWRTKRRLLRRRTE